MNKLAIIDGDALIYHSSKETLQESILNIDEKINNIFIQTQATHYVIFISNTPYFRHKIDPLYKNSRTKYTSPLKWLKTLKKYLIEGWSAQGMNLVEADDLCAYWMNTIIVCTPDGQFLPDKITVEGKMEYVQKILCSPDKDLLQSIYCIDGFGHFNYTYNLPDKTRLDTLIKGWWIETTESDADNFKRMQVIVGDASDGIGGLKGKGIKFWEKLSKEVVPSWGEILQLYIVDYGVDQGIFEFQKNYRLLHLLDTDEDFIREVGVLPTFPEIRQVPTKPIEEVNLEELKF